jgi:hypothetical protein
VAAYADEESLKLLLDRNGSSILTEEVVAAILRNSQLTTEMFRLMLTKISASAITQTMAYSIAFQGNQDMVQFVLAQKSSPVIFWAVVKGVAENTKHGGGILEILKPRLNVEIISDEMANEIASLANPNIIQILVDRKLSLGITPAVVQGAAKNNRYGRLVLDFLLPRLNLEAISDEMRNGIAYEIALLSNREYVKALLALKTSPGIIRAIFRGIAENLEHGSAILEYLVPQL